MLGLIFTGLLTFVSLYTHPTAYLSAMHANWYHITLSAISYLVVVVFLYFLVFVMRDISMMFRKAYALMKISSNPMVFIGNFSESLKAQHAQNYLNERMKIVNPEFVGAWSSLREHIQRWELEYFYEVCSHRIHITLHFNTVRDVCIPQLRVQIQSISPLGTCSWGVYASSMISKLAAIYS